MVPGSSGDSGSGNKLLLRLSALALKREEREPRRREGLLTDVKLTLTVT